MGLARKNAAVNISQRKQTAAGNDSSRRLAVMAGDQRRDVKPEDFRIDVASFDEQLANMPSDRAYWSSLYADAVAAEAVADMEFKRSKARAKLRSRAEGAATGKRVSEDEAECAALLDDDVSDAHAVLVEAEAEKLRMRGICDALDDKLDALQSLGAKFRKELEDPTLREAYAAEKLGEANRRGRR